MMAAGCRSEKVNKLKAVIEEANKECPVDLGEFGEISSLEFDDDAMEVQIHSTINEAVVSIDQLKGANNETARAQLRLLFSKGSAREMLDQIVDAGAGLSAIYKGDTSGETVKVTLSHDDLKDIMDNPMSETEINRQLLKNMLAQESIQFPMEVESGMNVIRSYDGGDYLVYDICIEEDSPDFGIYKEFVESGEAKNSICFSFNDPVIKNVFKVIVPLKKGLKYHYYGNKTGDSFDVTFTPDELGCYM